MLYFCIICFKIQPHISTVHIKDFRLIHLCIFLIIIKIQYVFFCLSNCIHTFVHIHTSTYFLSFYFLSTYFLSIYFLSILFLSIYFLSLYFLSIYFLFIYFLSFYLSLYLSNMYLSFYFSIWVFVYNG